jgi:hypothetical protein
MGPSVRLAGCQRRNRFRRFGLRFVRVFLTLKRRSAMTGARRHFFSWAFIAVIATDLAMVNELFAAPALQNCWKVCKMHTGPFMDQATSACFDYLNPTCINCTGGQNGYWCSLQTTTTPNCNLDIIPAHWEGDLWIPEATVQNTKYSLTRLDGGTPCYKSCANAGIGNGAPGYEATSNGATRNAGINVDQKKCE